MQRSCACALRLYGRACVKRFREVSHFGASSNWAANLFLATAPSRQLISQLSSSRQQAAHSRPALPDMDTMCTSLDKEQFKQQLQLSAIKIPTKECQRYMSLLSRHLLDKPRMKNIQDVKGDPQYKLLLLGEGLTEQDLPSLELKGGDGCPHSVSQLMEQKGLQLAKASVTVDYSYWTVTHVLQRVLPPGCEVPSSFEAVGHVAHLNLREEVLPWKYIVGQVILDKNPRLRTVVNKVGAIENEWRVFNMEVLASRDAGWSVDAAQRAQQGDSVGVSLETEVRQHGARFKLDFAKVYWNSRLEHEHHRLVGEFKEGEVVLDVMAGIGPFAVPAAQKGCTVWANDLNPDSFTWLRTNITLNKVSPRVIPFCLDGREAIRLAASGKLPLAAAAEAAAAAPKGKAAGRTSGEGPMAAAAGTGATQPPPPAAAPSGKDPTAGSGGAPPTGGVFHHAVMNLPASAVDFLDAFRGAFDPELWRGHPLPLVHVYTFCKTAEEDTQGMQRRVEAALGGPLDTPLSFHLVRDVAPNKKMYCISFRVPSALAFRDGEGAQQAQQGGEAGEPAEGSKRQKLA